MVLFWNSRVLISPKKIILSWKWFFFGTARFFFGTSFEVLEREDADKLEETVRDMGPERDKG